MRGGRVGGRCKGGEVTVEMDVWGSESEHDRLEVEAEVWEDLRDQEGVVVELGGAGSRGEVGAGRCGSGSPERVKF